MFNAITETWVTKAKTRRINGAYALLTDRQIGKDEIVLVLRGEIIGQPTKYSIQIGEHKHLEPYTDPQDIRSLIRFLNHSCDPSAYINFDDLTVRALRNLDPGEEVSFNYNTTEYEMANPFKCNCEAENCRDDIRGFKYLPLDEQIKLSSQLAPHLRRWAYTPAGMDHGYGLRVDQ